ncbi:Uncharacterised protein [Mycobacteroides abscessus subsp. abscessus]|nr:MULTISPECIES: hypothetical protein [Mycobacteriaceae]MBX9638455.1 hypothetical protein [Mycobacteriaceae bacterium]UGT84233.1 hypothetical protein LTS70_28300 [Mycobacterium kansasii]UGT89562.1 hypothetical protein LTT71_28300 [Mycobacterium kansasii]SIE16667.1 Uncharacterised protein [Mycobacteroides abscessus subsp. abscessus]SIN54063.1 Uncharacterised protein [Mycobacteroides abscessus subsp. abscessus]
MTADTLARVSVSVWLPAAAHIVLAAVAAGEGVSLPVLARRAAAVAVDAAGARVLMPSPPVNAVDELRVAGYGLNRLLPAADAALTAAQCGALAGRLVAVLDRITAASAEVRISTPAGRGSAASSGSAAGGRVAGDRDGWRLVRVTTDPDTQRVWTAAAQVAGFRSVANWVRDGLAGCYGLEVTRPPTAATTDARQVCGRVLGLIAQTEALDWPYDDAGLEPRIEAAGGAVWAALESLIAYSGDPKARR